MLPTIHDRRRGTRITPKGTVVIRRAPTPIHGRIVDLGPGGACIRALDLPADGIVGTRAALELRLDGPASEWLHLIGTVVRADADHHLAIVLDEPPAAYLALVCGEQAETRDHGGTRRVVLVARSDHQRNALAAAFRQAGCDVVAASTPLEAIVRVGEARYEPHLIAIADSQPDWIADELRAFLHVEHPRARMITIAADVLGPSDQRDWLSSRDPGHDLVERVRRLLRRSR